MADEYKEEKYVFTEKFLKYFRKKYPELSKLVDDAGLTYGMLTATPFRCKLRFPGIPYTATMEADCSIDTADAVKIFDYLPDVMPDWEDIP